MKTEQEIKNEIKRHKEHEESIKDNHDTAFAVAMDDCVIATLNWILTGEYKFN